MARPTTISNSQILDAAREVFLERGLAATTAEIAQRAGVSEGSVFRRFPTKDDLFLAAMGIRDIDDVLGDVAAMVGRGAVADNLRTIIDRKIGFYLELMPRMLVLMGCGTTLPHLMRSLDDPPPLRSLRRVTSYFDGELQAGRIRDCDPEVVARTLLGAAHSYAFMAHTGINEARPMARDEFARDLADLLLRGITPDR